MGGTLTLESKTGKGSTFSLRVPFETTASAEPAAVGPSRLEESKVLLVAPSGPTKEALLRLIRDRGGCAEAIKEAAGVADALAHLGGGNQLTDIIVDHRLTALGGRIIASLDEGTAGRIGRTMMVTPIERDALTLAKARDYSAWLIRPLRAASVAKVLRRETNGFGAWVEERRLDPAELSIGGRAPAGVAGRRLKVLLAEDNPVNALLVRAALERNGHEVTHVADGYALVEKAYDRARIASLFDLVLTDLSMPKMDGIAAVTAIRGFERNHAAGHLPIIVLSADGQHESHAKALEIGADDYVEKPVDPDLLLQTVERAAMRAGRMTAGR
jgi:CheY-like chemotaxis protein